jgi:eukaryotic-like serine/threonine-protein kinase
LVLEMIALRDQVKEEGRIRVEVLGRLEQEQIQLLLECPSCGRCYDNTVARCEADQSPLGLTLPVERVIDGKYRLERRIGIGGMGAVYEASDLRLQRTVAVKIMTGRLFGNTAAFHRFEREARMAARLQHPAIVAIYDFGSLRGEGAYLVMPLISGRSWRAEMRTAGQIRPARVARWMDQLCDAMAVAHASGVIHRDLKPENLLVTLDHEGVEKITVLDFGLAKHRNTAMLPGVSMSTEDGVVGTQGYMSPEQRRGEPVDDRSDVYAMAVITVELLTNSKPPETGASRRWLRSVLRWSATHPAGVDLAQLLMHCMADTPEQRPSVQELQRELVPLLLDCPPLVASQAVGANGSETVAKPLS